MRCEKTKQNYAAIVALACVFILVKSGHTAYNEARAQQGRWCFGKTPMQTFLDSRPLAHEKQDIGKVA
jgi:hypothetical protein